MSVPVLTFFNNKGGVGKTSLVYHLCWMFSELGCRVLACDLDPQANLTAAFLEEQQIEAIWADAKAATTIFRCVEPLMKVADLREPKLHRLNPHLALIPGDLGLSGFEDTLSGEWPKALGQDKYRAFRILTAFWSIAQDGAKQMDADIILIDVGPNLGAINRSALLATDYVVVPLGADLFSLQGLQNLGPTLRRWRSEWDARRSAWSSSDFPLPDGRMHPVGYVVQQHSVRLDRPVKAYDTWINRIPETYATALLAETKGPFPANPDADGNRLATIKHYRSLVPMAQEARKPIFALRAADGALGSHAAAVQGARKDFADLARIIASRIGLRLDGLSARAA
ncbi:MAG: AAA family ATPase, partial [Acetobacteraceae bacterium]|nr:AAA family ATPase [Acetobacteraceae bacterium]